MNCTQCGAANEDESVLCASCSHPLVTTPDPSAALSTGPLAPDGEPRTAFAPGQSLGDRYTVVERAGAGGMGLVYKAIDRRLGKTVALKLVQPGATVRPAARERFRRELALAQQVSHANVCRVHDLGDLDGTVFISMEYVEGQTLDVLVHAMGHLSPSQTVALGRQMCAGLGAIHARGIVHRDLKPANVMVDRLGNVLLMDFGMAYRQDQERLTAEGAVFGTLAYLSPEQTRGKAEARSDIYAVGLILYEMLTGKRPPGDDGPLPLALRPPDDTCPPPSAFSPEVPPHLDAIVMRCLEREPQRRFASAAELGDALAALGSQVTRTAGLTGVHPPPVRRRARGVVPLAVGAVVLAASAGGAWLLTAGAGARLDPGAARPPAIALLPLAYEGPQDSAYLKNLLPLALGASLERGGGFVVTPFATSRTLGPDEQARHAARQLGVDFVVHGRLAVSQGRGRGTMQLTAAGGETLWTRSLDDDLTQLVRAADSARDELARRLGVRPAVDSPARDPAAFRSYLEGLAHLDGWDVRADYQRAQAAFGQALRIQPHFAEAHAGLAMALLHEFNATHLAPLVERAAAAAELAVEFGPERPEPHVARGLVHMWRGQSVEASAAFERAAQLAPADDAIFRRVAGAYSRAGRHVDAEAMLSRAIDLRPGFWDTYNTAGVHYLRAGDVARAKEMFSKVTDLRPDRAVGYSNLAAALMLAGEVREAEPVLLAALRLQPSWDAHTNLALVYNALGRHAEAVTQAQQAIRDGGAGADAYASLGDALRHTGQTAEARRAYATAIARLEERLQIDPGDAEARAKLSMILAASGRCAPSATVAGGGARHTRRDLAYYLSYSHALCRRHEPAVRHAIEAIEAGMPGDIALNPDLAAVARDPRVQGALRERPVGRAGPASGRPAQPATAPF